MNESGKNERTFLVDNNVFISAIKNPAKNSLILDLLLECINNPKILLFGNHILIEEMIKYQDAFNSPTASMILSLLIQKTRIQEPCDGSILECKDFFPIEKIKDMFHAATALESQATIITNDKHFIPIKDARKIEVLTITEAIKELLPGSDQDTSEQS